MHFPLATKAARILAAGAGILAASAVLVWPIWSLATRSRRLYTALVVAALLILVAAATARRLKRRRRRGTAR